MTEDEEVFGKDVMVYCGQHLRPHATGWCTVAVRDKVKLDTPLDAPDGEVWEECRRKGLKIYGD